MLSSMFGVYLNLGETIAILIDSQRPLFSMGTSAKSSGNGRNIIMYLIDQFSGLRHAVKSSHDMCLTRLTKRNLYEP